VLRLARDLGVRDQPDVPSLALGSGLVTPLDLTSAYAVFPTLGYRVRPRGIVSVLNAGGERVHQVHVEREQILSEQVSFQMVTMLQDVIERGTGASARRLGVSGPVGGKTGSTNDYRDAWFAGSRCPSGRTSCVASRVACLPGRSRRRRICAPRSFA
jgi:membrane peptidoglycan carboxypeptidase